MVRSLFKIKRTRQRPLNEPWEREKEGRLKGKLISRKRSRAGTLISKPNEERKRLDEKQKMIVYFWEH